MYEFTCKVILDGQQETIKTFAFSIIEAIDNLVQMEGVDDVFSLTRRNPTKTWDFKGNFKLLKNLRGAVEDETLIIQEITDGNQKSNNSNKTH
jgi:hypothetical protein